MPLKTHFLDLIRLEFALGEKKIGLTMAILAARPDETNRNCLTGWSGKQFRQDVSNEIHQPVSDHVGCQIAAPQVESGQD
jgi:hypothetical protein